MKYTIHKNTHYALPLQVRMPRKLNLDGGSVTVEMTTTFSLSAAYNLNSEDQHDWNKLGGFSFGLAGIHTDSFRFGWRYNTETHMIELAAYEYINQERTMAKISEVALGQRVNLIIAIHARDGRVSVRYMVNSISRFFRYPCFLYRYADAKNAWLWYSGLYFGGNRRAPHKITINNHITIT